MTKRNPGFTLIELLIVVAIIAVLAAIAVPNFLEAQTRAKVSRVKADLRNYATAMESYRVDHNRYPIPSDINGRFIPNPVGATSVSPFETRLPVLLTTPIAYTTNLATDPFATTRHLESPWYQTVTWDYLLIRQRHAPSANWIRAYRDLFSDLMGLASPPPQIRYFMFSFGPDQVHSADLPHPRGPHASHTHEKGAIYDPTNGTLSNGDIFYFGPGWGIEG